MKNNEKESKEQCKVDMQIAWIKVKLFDKAADGGFLHVNIEEKRRVKLSQNF